MEFNVLGPLEVLSERGAVDLGAHKQRALLALLLLEANRVVPRDRLIDALWEDDPPDTAQKALQVYVSQLRKRLGSERVQTRSPGYQLRVEPDELDLTRFERLREEGKLDEALSLWRGPPLADFAYERFAQAEIARLDELHVACLEARIEADLAAGRHAELVGELDALVREHPLRERLRGQLILALYRSSRQAEALDAFQAGRDALVEELGIEPGRELRELHQAVLEQDPALELPAPAERSADPARGAFVGREPQLAALVAGIDDTFEGRGRLFLISGEPGIGKSRLAEEAAARARARGARVLTGRCWEAGGAPAYWPWVQSLRAYVRDTDTDTLRWQLGTGVADLVQVVPGLREHFPDVAEPPSLEPEAARFRLFDATAEFLRNAAEERPIVLLLDDLHAADTPSLLLLRYLARELGSMRLLVLGACRDVDPVPGRPLTELLGDVAREPTAHRVSLAGLSPSELAEYVDLTAARIASPELVAALHEDTEGNPLFAGEMVRLLAVEGAESSPADGERLAVPQSVRDVIARRLGHLSEECGDLLALAAVLGREFPLDALAVLAGVSQDDLLATLDEAMGARIVSDVPGARDRLRFAHVLIRDTLYEEQTTANRLRMHRLAAGTLAQLHGTEPGPHLAELAHHALAGGDFEKGGGYARAAGDRALDLLAYEESARLYASALDALEQAAPADEATRCALLVALGEARTRAGESAAAKRAFGEAAEIARRLGLGRELALAAAGYGGRIVWGRAGDDERLVPLLEDGLAALDEGEVELRARLLARLAGALRDEHRRDRRDALSREAVELARRSGDPAALAYALDGRAASIVGPDTVDECLALGTELLEVAEWAGNTERLLQGHFHRDIAELQAGDVRAAEADVAAASAIAEELGQPAHVWQAAGIRAMLAVATGRLAEADELVPHALELGERAQPAAATSVHHMQRYTLCDFRGAVEEAVPGIEELIAKHPARPVFRCALAHAHARAGRAADVERALGELGEDGFAAIPFDQEWLFALSLLAEAAARVGDTGSAAVAYDLIAPWAHLNVVDQAEGIRGAAARYLGLLAVTLERFDEAERHFEDAVAMNERMGLRPWLALTQDDYASTLLARDAPGDRNRAAQLAAAVRSEYAELGMEAARP